jgi:hypothetical protein
MSVQVRAHKAGLTISSGLYCNAISLRNSDNVRPVTDFTVATFTIVTFKLNLFGINTPLCTLIFASDVMLLYFSLFASYLNFKSISNQIQNDYVSAFVVGQIKIYIYTKVFCLSYSYYLRKNSCVCVFVFVCVCVCRPALLISLIQLIILKLHKNILPLQIVPSSCLIILCRH